MLNAEGNHRTTAIVLAVAVVLMTIIGGVLFFTGQSSNESDDGFGIGDDESSRSNNAAEPTAFAEMTKDEAVEYLKGITDVAPVPENFVNPDVELRGDEYALVLLYSYDNVNDVQDIAYNSVFSVPFGSIGKTDWIHVSQIDDRYAVASVNQNEAQNIRESYYRGVSFNKKYLDHYEDIKGTSRNDRIVFKSFDPSFVQEAMSIILYGDVSTELVNIYDYSFVELEDKFVFTTYTIGIGIDMENADMTAGTMRDAIQSVINLIERELTLEKSTGQLQWGSDSDGNHNRILKSFPITPEEVSEISEALMGYN